MTASNVALSCRALGPANYQQAPEPKKPIRHTAIGNYAVALYSAIEFFFETFKKFVQAVVDLFSHTPTEQKSSRGNFPHQTTITPINQQTWGEEEYQAIYQEFLQTPQNHSVAAQPPTPLVVVTVEKPDLAYDVYYPPNISYSATPIPIQLECNKIDPLTPNGTKDNPPELPTQAQPNLSLESQLETIMNNLAEKVKQDEPELKRITEKIEIKLESYSQQDRQLRDALLQQKALESKTPTPLEHTQLAEQENVLETINRLLQNITDTEDDINVLAILYCFNNGSRERLNSIIAKQIDAALEQMRIERMGTEIHLRNPLLAQATPSELQDKHAVLETLVMLRQTQRAALVGASA
ncbi:hypothetical protein FNU76_18215 [Chitinimonas arctica]|uniref:Uncharacterized protein n=1 Tax=Chitinimonas arctica TaxID=2594795 RepID=A0A516SIY8_9NEIS|nr:hypothetical protein [Chitinimonas arctica]QDQ28125.1 hypothetical protein FNU76_18215 [Chitinimonas arctica]